VKKTVESAQADRNAELKSLVKSQAQNIAELKAACTDVKCEKENVMAGYRRLAEKYKALEKADREKAELAEAQVT
jgi:uncharacterized coiled-coil protein SlyX